MVEFKQRFTLGAVDKILLDAAHDAEAIYRLLHHQHIEPFIDLNKRSQKNMETSGDIVISPEGIPICPNGNKMKPNGFEKSKGRRKWRCSPSCGCSNAKYGRTYHTHAHGNLRLFTNTVCGSDTWKNIYKSRTSIERSNKREKIDYKLESGRHRSTMMWYMRLYGIMTCQHLDAWYLDQKEHWDLDKNLFYPAVS
ncbi:hypothetical protein AB4Z29_05230 [Paenibacillus sp. 2TAB23]|uniref:hypothetical protein n=1 Tax=Paenibacillus sp. 2TAB23 TaxID=3233004 RepID=UPI003F981CF3